MALCICMITCIFFPGTAWWSDFLGPPFPGALAPGKGGPDIPVLFIIRKHCWAFNTRSLAPEGSAKAPGHA